VIQEIENSEPQFCRVLFGPEGQPDLLYDLKIKGIKAPKSFVVPPEDEQHDGEAKHRRFSHGFLLRDTDSAAGAPNGRCGGYYDKLLRDMRLRDVRRSVRISIRHLAIGHAWHLSNCFWQHSISKPEMVSANCS
jgi:hypothetical protein